MNAQVAHLTDAGQSSWFHEFELRYKGSSKNCIAKYSIESDKQYSKVRHVIFSCKHKTNRTGHILAWRTEDRPHASPEGKLGRPRSVYTLLSIPYVTIKKPEYGWGLDYRKPTGWDRFVDFADHLRAYFCPSGKLMDCVRYTRMYSEVIGRKGTIEDFVNYYFSPEERPTYKFHENGRSGTGQ